jgi:hypothetical protein
MTNAIATTILEQLGGNRFLTMTGAKGLLDTGRGLQMKLPTISRASCIVITLEADDTYTVQAYRGRGLNMCAYGEPVSQVYADSLRRVFEDLTGLYTKL